MRMTRARVVVVSLMATTGLVAGLAGQSARSNLATLQQAYGLTATKG